MLLCQAMVWLVLASVAIAITPFRFIARTASWGGHGTFLSPRERLAISRRVGWAVAAGACRVPWRAVCFQRGLAAHWMLRRRGVPSVLYYGAAHDRTRGLTAHVWVRDGDYDVAGGASSARFGVLATFPAQPECAPVTGTFDPELETSMRRTWREQTED